MEQIRECTAMSQNAKSTECPEKPPANHGAAPNVHNDDAECNKKLNALRSLPASGGKAARV
eukprot:CAMPEP_0183601436 /NCGR_PEP_ID=MMETSP0371-20130417/180443_1 /TAXON_ID=268820 /ORGANISM="Peridinium aciculiferum, Strain PAER-2" /LENGTH=60 /DNA_ID=CAMNT_0025813527 /DNA_START=316 /DNA_END=499 /DNA_ORIENTATION=-